MKKLCIALATLNLFDYVLTLLNLNNFEEANLLMAMILKMPFWACFVALTLIKLIVCNVFIYLLYRYGKKKIVVILLLIIYTYAVVLGILNLSLNWR